MAARALVIGGSGQIGQALIRELSARDWSVAGTCFQNRRAGMWPLDVADAGQVQRLFEEVRPRLVVNAMNVAGGADACERDPARAHRDHFEAGRRLAEAARTHRAKFVQLSTDYVFNGYAGPYAEDAPPAPLSELGRAKLRLEQDVAAQLPDALIVRTSFVFSWAPEVRTRNFAMQLLEAQERHQSMRVPTDQVANVTYAPNLAEALVELAELGRSGVYHLAGTTRCSKYAWAIAMVRAFGLDPALLEGVMTAELGQAAPRPLQSGFVLDKAQRALRRTRLLSLPEALADLQRRMGVIVARG